MARVVVITGGGTGIGAACARLMRAAGDRVFITGRREAPLQAVADETGATALVGDAADGEVWRQRLLPAILDQTGGIDVPHLQRRRDGQQPRRRDQRPPVARGAGRQSHQRLRQRSRLSAFADCPPRQCAVCRLHRLSGRRATGLRLRHRQTRFNRPDALRRPRLWPPGVRANAICPGWVTTPMADEEMHPLMQAEGLSLTEAYQRVCRDVPLRRPASPEEIAEACQFLCSPQAAIISGATLVADGGASIVDVPTLAFA